MIKKILSLLFIIIFAFFMSGCENGFLFQRFSLEYNASEGGNIEGESCQNVKRGQDSAEVIAAPETGYRFVQWSDGSEDAVRQDKNIKADLSVTAIFEKIVRTYTYIYNNATGNNSDADIRLAYETLDEACFIVPQKEKFTFNGWYLEADCVTKVSDEGGNLIIDRRIFESNSNCLYAKWTADKEIVYKVLMVYVTELYATLQTVDGTEIEVSYQMSEIEKKICEAISFQFQIHLNKLLDGLVRFEIDSYFTSTALGKDNIRMDVFRPTEHTQFLSYSIWAYNIPEVSGLLDDYRSVITTSCMNDYDGALYYASGLGGAKHASMHFESEMGQTLINNIPLQALLDLKHRNWLGIMRGYTHEFTHTIEQGLALSCSYHTALAESYQQGILRDQAMSLYLLNQLVINGKRVGIPYTFWENEIFTLIYTAEGGQLGRLAGWVEGNFLANGQPQRVAKGSDALTVTANAYPGYRFVGWSDGVMTATRLDVNVQSDLNLIAYFEPII